MRVPWRKVVSTILSLSLCGCAMLPAMTGTVSAATKIKIACVGDSITAGSQASSAAFHYPTQLQQLLGDGYEVKNFGVSGRTLMSSGDNPYVKEKQYTDSQNFAPDYVILMLGTNDAKTSNWTHKADFEADMKAMITAYRALASHPTVIVATSPTVGATNITIADAVVTGEVVPLQKKVAAEMGCPVIDINALTKNAPQNYADGIHPNDAGYTAMAKMMYEGLQGVWSAAITRFVVKGAVGTIDDTASTITVLVPADTALTALTPDITVANGAKLDKSGAQNFTKPVTYTVTSPDGKASKTYTVTVKNRDKIKIACIGDSVTVGVGGTSYPTQLQAKLGSRYEVTNFGMSGSTAQNNGHNESAADKAHYGYRTAELYPITPNWMDANRVVIDSGVDADGNPVTVEKYWDAETGKYWAKDYTVYQQSQLYHADMYIIAIGGNDAKRCNWTADNTFREDYRALIEEYQNLPWHPLVLIGTSPAMAGHVNFDNDALENEIVPCQRQTAAELGLPFAETYLPTKAGAKDYFIEDGVHLNTTGYGVIASVYDSVVRDAFAQLNAFSVDNGANRAATAGVIDQTANTVSLTLPAGTDITTLTPALSLEPGASYTPTGAQNFTKPVTYTITGANGSTRAYTVTVNQLPRVKVACVGDSLTAQEVYPKQLEEFLGDGYEVGHFGVNSTTAQKDGLKENGDNPVSGAYINHPQYQQSLDFKPDIVLLTLGSNDSKQGVGSQSGHKLVTNWKADSPQNYERDLKELIASYQAIGATVIFGTSPSGYLTAGNWGAKPDIVNNQIAPIQRKVAAEMGCFLTDFNKLTQGKETALIGGDGLHPNFNGYYLLASQHYINIQNVQAAITGFAVNGQTGRINQIDKEIHTIVPDGTDLTALTPTVTLAEGAQCDRAGKQNFGQPLPYTVTSAGGWVSTYTVTVTSPSGVTLSKIEMQTLPNKATYLLGDRLDTTGATVLATYTDGTQKEVPVTNDMVSGYDWLKAAKQTLTVSYEGKTTTFTVQVNPYGLLGTFSAMSGKFRVLKNGDGLLYADWKWADQNPIDLSGYGDRSTLSLELDIAFGSDNEAIDTTAMWSQLVIKLRSAELNGENNCGWNLFSSNMDPTIISGDKQKLHVSIPLNKTPTNKTGNMDWATTGRIIIQGFMFDNYKTNSIDHYMDIANVYIVDNSQKPDTSNVDLAELNAAIAAADTVDELSMYTPETAKAFEQTLALAKAYLNNPYASQEAVNAAASELTAAQQALTVKTILSGDVDENGRIDAVDALLTLQTAAEKVTLTKAQTIAADVDGTSGITAADALLILKRATGAIDTFPGARA